MTINPLKLLFLYNLPPIKDITSEIVPRYIILGEITQMVHVIFLCYKLMVLTSTI